jgi:coatomer subunit beta'
VDACIELLTKTNRLAEAVLFSQTYKPSGTAALVKKWKASLEKENKVKVARLLGAPPADGEGDNEMFPEWDEYLRLEKDGGTVADLKVEDTGEDAEDAEEEIGEAAEDDDEDEDEDDDEEDEDDDETED